MKTFRKYYTFILQMSIQKDIFKEYNFKL